MKWLKGFLGLVIIFLFAPVMSRVLLAQVDTGNMGQILADWDFVDSPDKAAPTVFQFIYREFALV